MAATKSEYRAMRVSMVHSEKLSVLTDAAERVYWRLIAGSDSYGTLLGSAWNVKSRCAPMVESLTLTKIDVALAELEGAGLVIRWEADGDHWVHISDFDEHQQPRFLDSRTKTRKTPVPPAVSQNTCKSPVAVGGSDCQQVAFEGHREDRTRSEEKTIVERLSKSTDVISAPLTPAAPTPPPAVEESVGIDFEPVPPAPSRRDAEVADLFEHWRIVFGKTAGVKLDRKRKTRAAWGVKTYGLEVAKRAVDGYALDEWRRAILNRHDLALIFRDAPHVEVGLELADNPAAAQTRGRPDAVRRRADHAAFAAYDNLD